MTEVFEGCLVVVSHDNFFVNRVAEHLFVFEGDGVVRDFEGTILTHLLSSPPLPLSLTFFLHTFSRCLFYLLFSDVVS